MQSLTLAVIMRAVFGFEPGPAEDELRARLRAMIEPLARRRGLIVMVAVTRWARQGRSQAAPALRAAPPGGR